MGVAFLYYWPTTLALVARAAPAAISATMMGIAFLTFFVANSLVGWIGGFYEKTGAAMFWLLHAAIAAGGGISIWLVRGYLRRLLGESSMRPLRPSAITIEMES